jgi:protein gp37
MAKSKIEWTDYTFNPWSGCAKVSAGCRHCYAATLPPHMRRGAEWGPEAERVPASEAYWKEPLRWAKAAAKEGVRRRVFCASVADVFEDRADLDPLRIRLWALIAETPQLDWLLLTKRPARMASWARQHGWPDNAWAGTSVEDQAVANERVPYLLAVPARVRFVSCEPLLGAVDLSPLWCEGCEAGGFDPTASIVCDPPLQPRCGECGLEVGGAGWLRRIGWVIVGGESGRHPRLMHPDWARSLRDQAATAGVPFLFKQWGEWGPADPHAMPTGDRVRVNGELMERRGRAETGRLLDGVEHLAFPR